ncbi:hypothetical protein WICPIJ_003140 [Wickerhamomyces pijperi]|uniref:Cystinosin n=1 Tax=Wickerhamomyces pijperi TaxID=599730 RepID=A0A9P8Q8B4_WICPI|nr:hypothetical protein WICPIJ_003140 [Wickerhamomyces pijperi]
MQFFEIISKLFGIGYVSAWSISFYPPLILNYQLKSSEGISIDFVYLNILGYVSLVTSMLLMLFNSNVRDLYFEKNGYYPLLTNIDLLYSSHGVLLTLVTTSQLIFSELWGFKTRSLTAKRATKWILISVITLICLLYLCIGSEIVPFDDDGVFTLLDWAVSLSYFKILMSCIKYIPQLLHNKRRRSIVGFSIFTIFLDLSGSILSTLQLFLDSYIATGTLTWDVMVQNSGKLGLSFITFVFDAAFFYQWFIYGMNSDKSLYESIPTPYREIA